MIFDYLSNKEGKTFYITLGSKHHKIYTNIEITQYIGISLETYINELKQFNVTSIDNFLICFFSEVDVRQAVEYLNIKYAVLLKLLQ